VISCCACWAAAGSAAATSGGSFPVSFHTCTPARTRCTIIGISASGDAAPAALGIHFLISAVVAFAGSAPYFAKYSAMYGHARAVPIRPSSSFAAFVTLGCSCSRNALFNICPGATGPASMNHSWGGVPDVTWPAT